MTHFLGLDVGTTRVKAVAFDLHGRSLATAERPTPWQTSPDGVEMAAEDLAGVVRAVVAQACSGLSSVAAIGVTGMGEAGVLTAGDPARATSLAPIRAWHDGRGDVETIRTAIGGRAFQRSTGMRLDAQPSLPKILRLRTDHPASAAATRFWSVPEWVVHLLGGAPGSELSLASRTGMLDVSTATAWPGAVDLLGGDLLGEPQPAGTPTGRADPLDGAPQVGGAVLAVGGHDHQCAALVAGAVRHGMLFDSLGTAEALLRFTVFPIDPVVIGDLATEGVTVGRTVVAGQFCVMAGLRTGMALERLAASLGAATRDQRRALTTDPAWLSGVTALVAGSQPALDRVRSAVGEHAAVLAAGGWFNDPVVLAAKQRQLPGLVLTSTAEAGAAGAAYLAGVAAGLLPPPETLDGPPWPHPTPAREAQR